jgi:arsenic resistance protein ArsH
VGRRHGPDLAGAAGRDERQFDDAGCMKPSAYHARVVDVMEEPVKFTLLTRDCAAYLVDCYSERKESAEQLLKRVNLRSI